MARMSRALCSSFSNLDPNWQSAAGPGYALKDFIKYALGL